MPNCPSCNAENIEGVDLCAECGADLFDLSRPESALPELGRRLTEESILKLQPNIKTRVLPENTVRQVVQTMCDEKASAVMVVHQDRIVGIFTERDFLLRVADSYDINAEEPIRKFMTPDPKCLEDSDSIAQGLNHMAVGSYRHIPVLDNGLPLAMVRTHDVVNYLWDHCQRAF